MRNAPPPNKKRKIKTVTEEKIDFDPAAREEYLTGFHKRKVARRKHAEEENAKKEKEEKLRFRKEVCWSCRARLRITFKNTRQHYAHPTRTCSTATHTYIYTHFP
jgi:uncharacterized protein YnzC (UPF0291/DUF896 family)